MVVQCQTRNGLHNRLQEGMTMCLVHCIMYFQKQGVNSKPKCGIILFDEVKVKEGFFLFCNMGTVRLYTCR